MLADGLTKAERGSYLLLRAFLAKGNWRIVYDERFVSARRRALLGKGPFDEITDRDVETLRTHGTATKSNLDKLNF